ncbi:right-handed parallel beta-helix repeat-containing protein, partial [bacterium]|nr:right-handed parallel beta-helix repeat-containing protein [bacterium]
VKFDAVTVLQIGTSTQQGALLALGKADTTISFSSNATTPAPGDWQGIHFQNQGRGKMDRCLVKEAGQGSLNAEITCAPGSGPTIQNCTIQESAGYGLILDDGAAPVLTANTFQDNAEYPVQVYGNYVPLVDTSNTFTGKGTNAIEVLGDEITDSATWPVHPIPYVIAGNLQVSKATAGDTLTLEPGTILKFKPQVTLQIGGGDPGVLIADGGASNITFTAADTAKSAHWAGLFFSSQGSGMLDSCLVAYGGAGARMANIYCAMSSDPVIQNCTIQTSQHYGVVCADGALPTITGNTFQHNGQYPIRIYANYVPAIGRGNIAQDNGTDAIEVLGDNITSSVTWIDPQMPYAIAGDVVVFSPAIGDTLTLEPGVTLSFNAEVELQLGKDGHPGTLLALGKPDSAITFTSSAEKASPGDWAGIFCDSLGT